MTEPSRLAPSRVDAPAPLPGDGFVDAPTASAASALEATQPAVLSDLTAWHAVQRRREVVAIRRFDPADLPDVPLGYALVRVLAAGICGADVRIVTGNKACNGDPDRPTTLGHEAVGIVEAVSDAHAGTPAPGDHVVVLPHLLPAAEADRDQARVDVQRIGAGRTRHMGWDVDGVFADRVLAPLTQLVPIGDDDRTRALLGTPGLGIAVFALTEPMLCTLSSYALIRQQERVLQRPLLEPGGAALVLGCGPIGILHATVLRDLGFDVTLHDPDHGRLQLAHGCLGFGRIVDQPAAEAFDLVVVAASSAAAILTGERCVRGGGLLYLFAGLNKPDRQAMDATGTFYYERVHRTARAIVTSADVDGRDKPIVYLGHSGYYDQLAPQAVAAVATHAPILDRAVTGVIPGWVSPEILGRGGVGDAATPDGGPALLSVLGGGPIQRRHVKLIVCPGRGSSAGRVPR